MICAVVLLTGCAFNHADRSVAFMGDKAYYVPVESVGYPVTRDMEKYRNLFLHRGRRLLGVEV